MKRKSNKGFTLVELIVVIAIIGILAAVLIPNVMGYIEKAKLANDKSDAKNMTTILQTYVLENNVIDLEAPDIRYIVNSSSKHYSFIPRADNYHFIYNEEMNSIEVMTLNEVKNELSNSNNKVKLSSNNSERKLEEIFDGYLLLDIAGSDIAEAFYKLRNYPLYTKENSFDYLKGLINEPEIIMHFDKYKPSTTLFVTNVDYLAPDPDPVDGITTINEIVFADGVVTLPKLPAKLKLVDNEGNAKPITIPYFVKVVETGTLFEIDPNNTINRKNSKTVFEQGSIPSIVATQSGIKQSIIEFLSVSIYYSITIGNTKEYIPCDVDSGRVYVIPEGSSFKCEFDGRQSNFVFIHSYDSDTGIKTFVVKLFDINGTMYARSEFRYIN